MSFVLKTIEAIGIFLGLGFLGFFLLAKKGIAKEALATLSFLSLDLAVPAMVFHDMMVLFSPTKYPKWWIYPSVWLLSFIFLYFLSLFFSFLFPKSYRKEAFVSLLYPNAIFIPLILLPSLFPKRPEITVDLFLFTVLYPFFLFQVFPFFYGSKKGFSLRSKRMFPTIVVVLLVSIFIHYLGLRPFVPRFLIDIARRVGVISVPLLLFVIGGNIYLDRFQNSHIPIKDKFLFVLIKNLAFPLITLFVLKVIPLPSLLKFLIFFQSALPPVTALPVFVEREGGNRLAVQAFFVWSVFAIIVTLPLAVFVYDKVIGIAP